ncbi:MAG: aldo/keto reductase [Eubacteriales bacterium]|nr:aldo/keto reductase [Eubacteriales bacterium]MDD4513022.1 aldo/keto reductase [Eubacteriales bacterium]
MQRNYLGHEIPKLGFGLMRLPMIDGEIDLKQVEKMVDTFIQKGFTYFDTAYVYAGGKSEGVARETLVKRYPREAFQLATKLPMWLVNQKSDMERYFSESLERAGVEYFDFYLLHGMRASVSDRFPSSNIEKATDFGAWEFIQRKNVNSVLKMPKNGG